ncbi:MAG: anthranilate synthase component I family protein [Balneolaceae bacterium]|nr:anthranilate synthase component I family protein [Balneolaceae bacterium]
MTRYKNKISLDTFIGRLQDRGSVILLDSQLPEHPAAEKTYLAARPKREIWTRGNDIWYRENGEITRTETGDPWLAVSRFQEQAGDWLFGYLGYDLKNHLEQLESVNPDEVGAPDLYMMVPGLLIEWKGNEWRVLRGSLTERETVCRNRENDNRYRIENLQPTVSSSTYRQMVGTAKRNIVEGNYYEINLSHQMVGTFSGNTVALYWDMKQAGPVPFGAFMYISLPGEEFSVCCASPERFLARRGNLVFSQPIKGTTRRGHSPEEDRELAEWLRNSEKNRAENLMIVDLVRNDLGKIAVPGSVRVPHLFEIQSFSTVHQMVSTVEANVTTQQPFQQIKACFPMGSMTGAPKISAMRSIDRLENYRRGIYSGAIGYVTPGQNFDFNVVIRTAIIRGKKICYSVGGAVTSDSDAELEWEETLVKAKAITDAVEKDSSGVRLPVDTDAPE